MKKDRLENSIKTAVAYAKVHLANEIKNKETGWYIDVNANGIKHTLGYDLNKNKSGRFIDLLFLVRKLKTIISDATLIETRNDRYGKNSNLIVHEFKYEIEYKGNLETIEIIIHEHINYDKTMRKNNKSFYNHKFVIEKVG